MIKKIVRIISVLFVPICGFAQYTAWTDSNVLANDHLPIYRPAIKSFILPTSLISLGAYSIHHTTLINRYGIQNSRDRQFQDFHVPIDDWLQYAPILGGFVYGAIHDQDRLWLYTKRLLLTTVINSILVQTIKKETHILRPDGSSYNAFPSGHTTNAFAAATLFSDHFARHKPWLSILAYTSASTVGVFRILNNRHWASDVIAGAGFGILSAKLSQVVFQERKKCAEVFTKVELLRSAYDLD